MRRGEILALKWSDLNFKTGELRIERQVYIIKAEVMISAPKTKASIRTVNKEQSSKASETEKRESSTIMTEEKADMPTLKLRINGKEFTATLYDTQATRALLEKLPMTLIMQELNGNEKYNYLPFALPTSNESVGNIKTGDIMLWGDNCLVLFYENFSTSYSYTKIGYIENPTDFSEALGLDDVTVEFNTNNSNK